MKFTLLNDPASKKSYIDIDSLPDGKRTLGIFLTLALGLWIDRLLPFWGQVIAGLMAWGLFGTIYLSMPRRVQHLLLSCLIVATMGEIFCSLIWKLYDYRLFNIPPYVPPGHVLVFLLGSYLSHRMPKFIVWVVPALAAPYVILGYRLGFDEFGIILFGIFSACLIAEQNRRLYATMFVLCLLLEIYGTMLGNWTWRGRVPVWELKNTNPPLAAGAFYCVLDFLMLRLALAFWSGRTLYRKGAFRLQQRLVYYTRLLLPDYALQADTSAGHYKELKNAKTETAISEYAFTKNSQD